MPSSGSATIATLGGDASRTGDSKVAGTFSGKVPATFSERNEAETAKAQAHTTKIDDRMPK